MSYARPSGLLFVVALCSLYSVCLAALAMVQPQALNVSGWNSIAAGPTHGTLPDHVQVRVSGTSMSLVFGKYTGPVPELTSRRILERAQYEMVKAVVTAHGDAIIAQPTFEWRHGRLYVRMQQHQLEMMTWSMMSNALWGITMFADEYGYMGCQFEVLDDTAGLVGSGSVGLGYT